MIITLKGADFSTSNIGTLSSWNVKVLGSGVTYSGVSFVDKDTALNATITIADGYELSDGGVTVTMGGNTVTSGITVNGNTITVAIASVTGNVVIKVSTVNTTTGDGGNTGSGDTGESGGDEVVYVTLTHGNDYNIQHADNTKRASIQPYTIMVPTGVTITPKDGYKWAWYFNADGEVHTGSQGPSGWVSDTYTGSGKEIGIAFRKEPEADFDFSVDSIYASDYFITSDESIWVVSGGTGTGGNENQTAAYTITIGNDYNEAYKDSTNRVSIQPYTIMVPTGVTITPKSGYKWGWYKGVNIDNMPSGSLATNGGWVTDTYTGTGAEIGIAICKEDDSAFDLSVDSIYASDYFITSDPSIWGSGSTGVGGNSGSGSGDSSTYTFTINPTPSTATVTLTASGYTQSGNSITVANGTNVSWSVSSNGYTTKTGSQTVIKDTSLGVVLASTGAEATFDDVGMDYGNPKGVADQQTSKARIHSVACVQLEAGQTVTLIDNTTYKWACSKFNDSAWSGSQTWLPSGVWTDQKQYTITTSGYYGFVVLRADNANITLTGTEKLTDYFSLS